MIKQTCLILLLAFTFSANAQDPKTGDEEQIMYVINRFFKSLETRDTVLFKDTTLDVFTLFEINGKWKIISAAYTIEKENCAE